MASLYITFCFFPCRNAAHGFSLIPVDSLKITMKEILQKALKKRKGSQKGSGKVGVERNMLHGMRVIQIICLINGVNMWFSAGPLYRLEKQTEPNVSVDLDSTLETQSTLEFCLVRENSKCVELNDPIRMNNLLFQHDRTAYTDVTCYCCCTFVCWVVCFL